MNYEETKAMVERLKTTVVAFGGLGKEEQEFLKENDNHSGIVRSEGLKEVGNLSGLNFCDYYVYRLSPDFQLPAPAIEAPAGYLIVSMEDRKRCEYPLDCEVMFRTNGMEKFAKSGDALGWCNEGFNLFLFAVPADYVFAEDRVKERFWFNPSTKDLMVCEHSSELAGLGYIEITAEQKRYLETKPKAEAGFEWVRKVPDDGEQAIALDGKRYTEDLSFCSRTNPTIINGIRWVKVPAKPSPRFVEYPVVNDFGVWKCKVEHRKELIGLAKLPSIVGFAGVKFDNGYYNTFFPSTTWISPDETPATPIAARFYINGETK